AIGRNGAGKILDVACGPGIVSVALAKTARAVVAFDLTPEMLAKARDRCAKAGLTNVTLQEGSATELPFAPESFDGVVTRLAIHHLGDPGRPLAAMFRVLPPAGTLVSSDAVTAHDA